MNTLLRIDASARIEGSHSRQLADYVQQRWMEAHAGGRVLTRDLGRDPVPHLDGATIAAFHAEVTEGSKAGAIALSDALVAELIDADFVLISSPLYNFSLPSTLKAYLDHVVRFGRTFTADANGYVGLLAGKAAYVVTARGGMASPNRGDDFQIAYLDVILRFMGIESIDAISLDGTAREDALAERVARARAQIDAIFTPPSEPAWVGAFTGDDRRELNELRAAQAAAIERGDAEAYARLVTEDVGLMIPGQDILSGRERFLDCETRLFRGSRFARFRKQPERIERSGDLAIEIGRQEVVMQRAAGNGGVFAARQKYTHVFRRTAAGWRFAVLMSNPSE